MAGLVMAAIFTACSKDKDSPAAFNIAGVWEGKLGSGANIPNGFFGLNIKSGGKLDRVSADGEVTGTGTWTMEGTTFKGHYVATSNGVEIDVTAGVDKAANKLSGTWENSGDNSGTWYANKK